MAYGHGKAYRGSKGVGNRRPALPVASFLGFIQWAVDEGYELVPPRTDEDVARIQGRTGVCTAYTLPAGATTVHAEGWGHDLVQQYLAVLETRVKPGRLKGPPLIELLRKAAYGRQP